jgi:dipeptidyl aminopeptidase/acylaminoacyl peptidase
MKNEQRWTLLGWGLAFVLLGSAFALAQAKRPMTMVDLLEIPSLSDAQLSPDGQELLFVLAQVDWEANGNARHIWRGNVDGSPPVQLTHGSGESSPRWSPDGKWIAYLARPEDSGETQIYLMSSEEPSFLERILGSEGGEPITDLELASPRPSLLSVVGWVAARSPSISNITWAPDSSAIYFLAPDPPSEEEKRLADLGDDVFAFNRNYKQWHLFRAAIPTGAVERVTDGDYSVLSYQLSRDGQKIAHHRGPTPLYQDPHRSEVWVMGADGQNALQLTDNEVPESSSCCGAGGARLSPDNEQVLFLAKANEGFEYYYKSSLFLVPASGGEARLLLPDLPYELRAARWSENGDTIFLLANMGVHSELFELDVATEELRQLTDGKHSVRSWALELSSDRHVLTIAQPDNPGDVWLLPVGKSEASPTRVTHVFDYLARDFELPRQEKVEWKSVDGVTVEGLLDYPLNFDEGETYPLVVQSHGGMANSDQFGFGRWSSYIQVLAARGYAVLRTNYRGSGGYGDEFQRDMIGRYFNNSHLDVMAGLDHVIELGIADPDRLIKRGWSAGGFMTNKIITFTDRFKAASSGAGVVNWISFYSQSDIRHFRDDWLGGSPWQKDPPSDNFWEQSPLSYISNVKTPTIIFVGENDVRVPPEQSIELYRALEFNGVPTRLYIAPREPHGWRELRHRLFKMNAELEWFEKYAMGREYEWEKVPEAVDRRTSSQ